MASSRLSNEKTTSSRGRTRLRRGLAAIVVFVIIGLLCVKFAPSILREVEFFLVHRAVEHGQLAEAEARLELMIHQQPTQTRARLLLVQALRKQQRITEAEEVLQRTIELGLPVEEGRREFALLTAYSDFPTAEKSLRRLLEANPDDLEVRQAILEGQEREAKKR